MYPGKALICRPRGWKRIATAVCIRCMLHSTLAKAVAFIIKGFGLQYLVTIALGCGIVSPIALLASRPRRLLARVANLTLQRYLWLVSLLFIAHRLIWSVQLDSAPACAYSHRTRSMSLSLSPVTVTITRHCHYHRHLLSLSCISGTHHRHWELVAGGGCQKHRCVHSGSFFGCST